MVLDVYVSSTRSSAMPARIDIQWPLLLRLPPGLTHAASAPADLRFAFCVTTHAQGSLPAGWLAFAGRASNPLNRYERFQFNVHPPFLFSW